MQLWIPLWILIVSCIEKGEPQGRVRQPPSMPTPTASRLPDAPVIVPAVAPPSIPAPAPVAPIINPSNANQMRPSAPGNQIIPTSPPLIRHRPPNKGNDEADGSGSDNTGKTGILQSGILGNLLGSARPLTEQDPCSPANIPIVFTVRRCANSADCPPGFFCDVSAWKCGSHWCNSFQSGALVFR